MKLPLYALPASNRMTAATITVVSGVEDTDYPAPNLQSLNPARPAKLLTTSGAWLLDLGTAVCLDIAALIHHNFTPGATAVRLEANAADAWDDPPLSEALIIPSNDADEYPRNPWLDLRVTHPAAADRTYRYWRVSVEGNAVPVALCEILLCSNVLALECTLQPGFGDNEDWPDVEHSTDAEVTTIHPLGTKVRSWSGELDLTEAATNAAFRTLRQAARGRGRGFLFIPDAGVNDAWFARFDSTKYSAARQTPEAARHMVGFEEISRGLPL